MGNKLFILSTDTTTYRRTGFVHQEQCFPRGLPPMLDGQTTCKPNGEGGAEESKKTREGKKNRLTSVGRGSIVVPGIIALRLKSKSQFAQNNNNDCYIILLLLLKSLRRGVTTANCNVAPLRTGRDVVRLRYKSETTDTAAVTTTSDNRHTHDVDDDYDNNRRLIRKSK